MKFKAQINRQRSSLSKNSSSSQNEADTAEQYDWVIRKRLDWTVSFLG